MPDPKSSIWNSFCPGWPARPPTGSCCREVPPQGTREPAPAFASKHHFKVLSWLFYDLSNLVSRVFDGKASQYPTSPILVLKLGHEFAKQCYRMFLGKYVRITLFCCSALYLTCWHFYLLFVNVYVKYGTPKRISWYWLIYSALIEQWQYARPCASQWAYKD